MRPATLWLLALLCASVAGAAAPDGWLDAAAAEALAGRPLGGDSFYWVASAEPTPAAPVPGPFGLRTELWWRRQLVAGHDEFGRPRSEPIEPWLPAQQVAWQRLAVLHSAPELAPQAAQAARLLGLAAQATWAVLGREPRSAPEPAGPMLGRPSGLVLWLTAESLPGDPSVAAEERGGELILWRAAEPWAPGELARQLVHELGHRCGPRLGRFATADQHEPWLEGELAELLVLPSLAAEQGWTELAGQIEARRASALAAWRAAEAAESSLAAAGGAAGDQAGNQAAERLLGLAVGLQEAHGPAWLRAWAQSQSPHAVFNLAGFERSARVFAAQASRASEAAAEPWPASGG